MEIGVYRGVHARQMIETASKTYPIYQIEYYGFDMFEGLTNGMLNKEFSKRPQTYDNVKQKLEKTGAAIRLYKGYSEVTLPKFVEEKKSGKKIDLVFIDGGHSIETIASDWNHVKTIMDEETVVIFDDYYSNDEPEVGGVGCQSLINSLDRSVYDVEILEPQDHFLKKWGTLKINMVKVGLKDRLGRT